jgi:hypothetical protein
MRGQNCKKAWNPNLKGTTLKSKRDHKLGMERGQYANAHRALSMRAYGRGPRDALNIRLAGLSTVNRLPCRVIVVARPCVYFGSAGDAVEPSGTDERIKLFHAAIAKATLCAGECFAGAVDGCHSFV